MKHYIASGRIPGVTIHRVYHLELEPGKDPYDAFVERIYADEKLTLPTDWVRREPTVDENSQGHWTLVNALYEIPGPPVRQIV